MSENKFNEKEYIESGGNICPFCGGRDISGLSPYEGAGDCVFMEVECLACYGHWDDVYRLDSCIDTSTPA